MRRPLLLGLIVTLAVAIGALWWVGTSASSPHPSVQPVQGMADSATIYWTSDVPRIEAEHPNAALSALGYVHGLKRGWTLALWRQTALGTLSRWFGAGVLPLDRHARRLGLARSARAAYENLPRSQKRQIRAYTSGLNAALNTPAVRDASPFLLLGITPSRWAPWHTLVVERLLAWLATGPVSAPPEAPPAVRQFRQADHRFRRWLHLHGWERSVAWAVRPSDTAKTSSPLLFHRQVLGASALPVVQEVVLDVSSSRLTWATLPGTLLPVTGVADDRAWASLLNSPRQITRRPARPEQIDHWYERLTPSGGDERLLRVERLGNALPLGDLPSPSPPASPDRLRPDSLMPPPDTTWVVEWPGFSSSSDIQAWLQRGGWSPTGSDSSTFRLYRSHGLEATVRGSVSVLGRPPVVDRSDRVVVAGRSFWAREQGRNLRAAAQRSVPLTPASLTTSDSSTWASSLLPHLEPALRESAFRDGPLRNATTYLRNWDHRYDPRSIGALLFDEWMRQYKADLGHVPTLADTAAYFARYRLRRAFRRALDSLVSRLGPDVRRWRWERVVTDRRYFPVWSADSLVEADLQDLASSRYAPLDRTGRGHPSTLDGGPSLVDPVPLAASPDTWEGWMRPGGRMTVRRARYNPEAFFARSQIRPRPAPQRLAAPRGGRRTVLVPAE